MFVDTVQIVLFLSSVLKVWSISERIKDGFALKTDSVLDNRLSCPIKHLSFSLRQSCLKCIARDEVFIAA